jgi:methylglyoxal reductase
VSEVPREDLVLVSKAGYFTGTAEHGYAPSHMRRQLEQTLENLGTDHLDVYFFHHSNFGAQDRWLPGAVEAMRCCQGEGLIRAVGMRGPHRFTLDRLTPARTTGAPAGGDKVQRFHDLFTRIGPQVLAVRDNLLSPPARSARIFAFAQAHDVGVLVNKPLAQGLLTGVHDPDHPPVFGPGDHRLRKRWFTAPALWVIAEGLEELRGLLGPGDPLELVRVAVWACLQRCDTAIALLGFTTPVQVRDNLAAVGRGPVDHDVLTAARQVMAAVQQRLDADGEVFTDERAASRTHRADQVAAAGDGR